MPKSRQWPYPLDPGTHVVAQVRKLDLSGDAEVVGTVVRTLYATMDKSRHVYAVKIKDGGLIQALASRTVPVDTSTVEGLDRWLDAFEASDVSSANLPGLDLGQTQSDPDQLLWARGGMQTTTTTTPKYLHWNTGIPD